MKTFDEYYQEWLNSNDNDGLLKNSIEQGTLDPKIADELTIKIIKSNPSLDHSLTYNTRPTSAAKKYSRSMDLLVDYNRRLINIIKNATTKENL